MKEYKKKIFGTDGVRGIANTYPMNSETILKLGRAVAYIFHRDARRHQILIGKDTRLSGYMLETAMASGICSMGVDVLLVGPLPTPAIALMTRDMRADAGVVISASHNPFQDNGIKIFAHDGFKLPNKIERQIEQVMFENSIDKLRPTARAVGKAYRVDDAAGRYIVACKHVFPKHLTLEGMKIVVDCAHGAAYRVAPAVFEELGAKVIPLGVMPNGSNINRKCGSLCPQTMREEVLRHGADLGIALDGDGDRVVMASEKGELLNGDQLLAIYAHYMHTKKTLNKETVVATIMSNMNLEKTLSNMGIKLVYTPVGDRYVVEAMLKGGYNLGGEQSGHLVLLDHASTGDGIMAALTTLSVMLHENKPLSELARVMTPIPQVLVNKQVIQKIPLEKLPKVQRTISQIKEVLGGSGRVLVRYSGTENKVRVMVEGEDKKQIELYANEIAESFI